MASRSTHLPTTSAVPRSPPNHLRFHRYDHLEPSPDIGNLLREIDRDPSAIFWG